MLGNTKHFLVFLACCKVNPGPPFYKDPPSPQNHFITIKWWYPGYTLNSKGDVIVVVSTSDDDLNWDNYPYNLPYTLQLGELITVLPLQLSHDGSMVLEYLPTFAP